MDILDQIDQALREVDEEGWFTDAMRWVPGGSSDAQEADTYGGRYHEQQAVRLPDLDTVLMDMVARYEAHLDEAVLSPRAVPAAFGRQEVADVFEVPPELLRTMAPPPEGVSGLYSALDPTLAAAVSAAGIYHWQLDRLHRLLSPPPPMTPGEVAALEELGSVLRAQFHQSVVSLGGQVADAMRPMFNGLTQAAQQLEAAGLMPEPPPEHPLERVRWLRAQRGSGPPSRQRAPRRIDPRGTR